MTLPVCPDDPVQELYTRIMKWGCKFLVAIVSPCPTHTARGIHILDEG